MEPKGYLEHLRADAAALLDAAQAAGLSAPVPTCPGWDVAALVGHVGGVYEHKVACMRLGRAAGDRERSAPAVVDVVAWFGEQLADLVAELEARGPDEASWTWFPPDQTVGFWFRRMAQETAVHRVDAEAAAGRTSTIDSDLALDGIDELLGWLTFPWGETRDESLVGLTYAVRSADRTWRMTLEPTRVRVDRDDDGTAATGEVSGTPYDVLMWVWGRPSAATTRGDTTALRDELAQATS